MKSEHPKHDSKAPHGETYTAREAPAPEQPTDTPMQRAQKAYDEPSKHAIPPPAPEREPSPLEQAQAKLTDARREHEASEARLKQAETALQQADVQHRATFVAQIDAEARVIELAIGKPRPTETERKP